MSHIEEETYRCLGVEVALIAVVFLSEVLCLVRREKPRERHLWRVGIVAVTFIPCPSATHLTL